NPNSDYAKGVSRARGFFVHYLALTFSTLLSSQVSGAHRTGLVLLRLGAATHNTRSGKSESNPDLLVHPGPSEPGFDASLESTHQSEHLVGQWIPPGSAATDR